MAQFGWCSLKLSRRLSTHIHLQTNKIKSIFTNILPLFQSGCCSLQTHPSNGSSHCNVLEAKTQYSSGTSLRCPLDIFAPALPPFPASRYAELVSGGHLPTISVRSAHQCAGRAVYFAKAKYGKAKRPPGVATTVAVRGLVPPR